MPTVGRVISNLRHISNTLFRFNRKKTFPNHDSGDMQNIFIFKPDDLASYSSNGSQTHKHYQFQLRKNDPVPVFKLDTTLPPTTGLHKADENVKRMQTLGSWYYRVCSYINACVFLHFNFFLIFAFSYFFHEVHSLLLHEPWLAGRPFLSNFSTAEN